MFYQELLEIENEGFSNELINKMDKWLAFLPTNEKDIITASRVSTKFGVDYSISEMLLVKLEEIGLLEENYIILCPECEREIILSDKEHLEDDIRTTNYCIKCSNDILVKEDNIYRSYKLIKLPSSNEDEIKKYAKEILGVKSNKVYYTNNESLQKLLSEEKVDVNDFFSHPLKRKKKK